MLSLRFALVLSFVLFVAGLAADSRYLDGSLTTLICLVLVPPLSSWIVESLAKLLWVRKLEAWLERRSD